MPKDAKRGEEAAMKGTILHWTPGPWPGKLAVAARPRGGDWLDDEMASWRAGGADTVLSLLTAEEEHDLDLVKEPFQAEAHGMTFLSFPIRDREVPESESAVVRLVEQVDRELSAGRNVVVHCRQGVGRTGVIAACLLVSGGVGSQAAVQQLSATRGTEMPETAEQRRWIDDHAATFAIA